MFKGGNSIPHFIIVKIGFDKSDLDVGFAGVQFALFNNVGVFDDGDVFLAIFVTIEMLESLRNFRQLGQDLFFVDVFFAIEVAKKPLTIETHAKVGSENSLA